MTKDRRAVWVAMEKSVPLVLKVFATHPCSHIPSRGSGAGAGERLQTGRLLLSVCSTHDTSGPRVCLWGCSGSASGAAAGWVPTRVGRARPNLRIHGAPWRRTGSGYSDKTFHCHIRNQFKEAPSPI